jgi:hypothetical protein
MANSSDCRPLQLNDIHGPHELPQTEADTGAVSVGSGASSVNVKSSAACVRNGDSLTTVLRTRVILGTPCQFAGADEAQPHTHVKVRIVSLTAILALATAVVSAWGFCQSCNQLGRGTEMRSGDLLAQPTSGQIRQGRAERS